MMTRPVRYRQICILLLATGFLSGCSGWHGRLVSGGRPTNALAGLRSPDKTTQAEACRRTGMELAAHDRDEHAIAQFERALRIQPEIRGVTHHLAVLYDRQGRVDDAERAYRRALKESPRSADVLNDYGYFQYSLGMLDEAEACLQKALNREPSHHRASVNMGVVYAAKGDYDRSFQIFERTIGTAAAHHNVGMLLARAGRTDEAVSHLQQAVHRDPSLSRSQAVLARLQPAPADSGIRQVSAESVDSGAFWEALSE